VGSPSHFSSKHPLAGVVARLCDEHLGELRMRLVAARGLIGGVGCGACWERAIRNDEGVVVRFDLPPELVLDPTLVDEIAVELACRGERVALTAVERSEVLRRWVARGVPIRRMAELLQLDQHTVSRHLAALRVADGRSCGEQVA
jgi:DNA-binding CsgD family transcriptional regulator